jgi:hypothetical protein
MSTLGFSELSRFRSSGSPVWGREIDLLVDPIGEPTAVVGSLSYRMGSNERIRGTINNDLSGFCEIHEG